MKYSSISISNFRAIENLYIDNFKQVNVFTGRNNCGKTTVLEALFQISGMSNPQLPITIHNIRDLILGNDDSFNFIFRNLDFNQNPHIDAILDGIKRDLIIKPKYAARYNKKVFNTEKINLIPESKISMNDDDFPVVGGLCFEFTEEKNNEKFISEISLSENIVNISNHYREKLRCSFHSTKHSMAMLPQRINKLLVNKQMRGIIKVLKEIDPKISDMQMGDMGMIYIDIGLDKLLPINIMGDGIRRILSMIAAVSDVQGGVLLIDEIENGLHYSTLKTLWKALLKAAEVYNVQLFATTHSNECIDALVSSYEESNQESDDIRLYRIEKQDDKHRVFEYSAEMIATGIDNIIEMR